MQLYHTKRGAERYAAELLRKWPHVKRAVVIPYGFKFAVEVTTESGRVAYADKRPRRFGDA